MSSLAEFELKAAELAIFTWKGSRHIGSELEAALIGYIKGGGSLVCGTTAWADDKPVEQLPQYSFLKVCYSILPLC